LLWGLAGQLMTLRQGKRRFGLVSAGEPVAVIVCGLTAPALLTVLAPADLFMLSAGAALLGMVLVVFILQRHQPVVAPDHDTTPRPPNCEPALLPTPVRAPLPTPVPAPLPAPVPAPPWWHNRTIVTMVVLVAVGQLAYFFVDNAFYLEAGRRYPQTEELAAFLGLYSAAVGTASLLCGALLAPWLLRRFGVRAGMLMLPLLLLALALATVISATLGGAADQLFALVVASKVGDQSLRYTLDKTTFVTLLQPLPGAQRLRVQAGLESIVEPLSGGVAGLLLFFMLQALGVGAAGISAAVSMVACVWVAMVAVQYRGYLRSLRAALAGLASPDRAVARTNGAQSVRSVQSVQFVRDEATMCRQALLDEIDGADAALSAWASVQHDTRPDAHVRRRQLAAALDASVKNCFVHLAGLLHNVDMRVAYTYYAHGGQQPRSYVMELLDNLLDDGLKRRLLPLLEARGTAEQGLPGMQVQPMHMRDRSD
jgi:hypothetical protein